MRTRLIVCLIAVGFFISLYSCRNRVHTYQNVLLNKSVADSVPFCSVFRIARKAEYTGIKDFAIPDMDSIVLKKIIIPDDVSAEEKTAPDDQQDNFKVLIAYRGKKIFMVFDTNNNGHFDDEKVYDTDTCRDYISISNLDFNGGKIKDSPALYIKPMISYIMGPAKPGVAMMCVYKQGIFTSDHSTYKLAVFNQFDQYYTRENSDLVISPESSSYPSCRSFPVHYRVGDTIYLTSEVFSFANISKDGDTLMLEKIGTQKVNYGVETGDFAFGLQAKNILDGTTYTIGKSGKYTLLDFWGIWCGPCKAVVPDLKKLQESAAENDFQIVSIAYDRKVEEVTDFLQSEDIHWINLFDDMENSKIAGKFKITAFPTFILLDDKGKIVFRGSGGKEVLERVKSLLSK